MSRSAENMRFFLIGKIKILKTLNFIKYTKQSKNQNIFVLNKIFGNLKKKIKKVT